MEWQPIETMPKDEKFDVWSDEFGRITNCSNFNGSIWDSSYPNSRRIYDATHWMPLPEPPK